MDSLGLVFLGVIALSSLVQGLFLVFLALNGLKLARRMRELQARVEGETRPALDDVARMAANLVSVSEVASAQAERLEAVVALTIDKVEDARMQLQGAVGGPLESFRDLGAVLKGLRRGFDVYQRLGSVSARKQGTSRRYVEDEHLFI
jgi:hypothetical protein